MLCAMQRASPFGPGGPSLFQLLMAWLSFSLFIGVPLMFLETLIPGLNSQGWLPVDIDLAIALVVLPLGWVSVLDQLLSVQGASEGDRAQLSDNTQELLEAVHGLGAEISQRQLRCTLWLEEKPESLTQTRETLAKLIALGAALS